ncbi:MAG TPA: 50S ribosomal protein L19 [Candidatus Paceibacterota bacterium]
MKKRAALGLRTGDVVRVWQKIEELKKTKQANKKEVLQKNTRRQAFEGTILAVKHGTEPGATFTVRKVSLGVGVERIFPLYTPMIDEVEVLRRTRTRRAKLYFIREKAARDQKRAMRRQLAVETPEVPVEDEVKADAPTAEEFTNEVPEVNAEAEQTAAEATDKVE